jgi:hypothetical protein
VQSTNHDEVDKYKRELTENIFSCMEMSKQSYIEIVNMPVKKFYDYLSWKIRLEEEKKKIMDEENNK